MTAPLADILRELLGEEGHDISLSDEAAARIVEGLLASADLARARISGRTEPVPTKVEVAQTVDAFATAVAQRLYTVIHTEAWRSAREHELRLRADLLKLGRG